MTSFGARHRLDYTFALYLSLTSMAGYALPPCVELPGVLVGDSRETPQLHMNEPMLMFLIMPRGGVRAGLSSPFSLASPSSLNSLPP